MTNDPGDRPPGDSPDDNNPFKGTPFEQIFAAFSGGMPGGPGSAQGMSGMPDLSMLMSQMQSMMAPHEGSVNWKLATDVARKTAAQEPDPSPSDGDRAALADAVRLADHWLDQVTDLPSGVSTSAVWSRAEWIEETVDVWRRLVEPVAEHVVSAMGNALPEEAKSMAGPLLGMLGQAGGAMFGTQVGQALGGLAGEVLTASDIGLPLGPAGKAAVL
ncbi:MAG: zinc-dependent metalloprotease, partial [Nocardioides sp.]